jgi:hypothetical protein
MAAGDPIGRLFNITHTADNVYVSLKEAGAVTFVGQLSAGDTFTVTSASDASGTGAAVLTKVTKFNTAAAAGGVWTTTSQAAASTFVTSDSKVATATIRGEQLPDGHDYVKCASTSTGTVMAITHDLKHQATPSALASVIA